MTPLSVRLDQDVREFYDRLAQDDAVKTTTKLRSLLTKLARRSMELKKERVTEVDFMSAAEPELPLLMAAEPVKGRRED